MATCLAVEETTTKEICSEIHNLSLTSHSWRSGMVRDMKEDLLNDVCMRLDTESLLLSGWRALGSCYDVQPLKLDNMALAYKARQSPARELFQYLGATMPQLTIQELLDKLEKIQRIDIKEEIENFMERMNNKEQLQSPEDDLVDGCSSQRVTEAHCRELSKKLRTHWKPLLRAAKMIHEIDEIEDASSTISLREKSYRALIYWKESGTVSKPKTLKDLEKLLRDIRRNDLADKLEENTNIPIQSVEFNNDGPVDENTFTTALCEEIGTSWMWVMRYLDMPEQKIRNIDCEYKSQDDKVYKALCLWCQETSGASKRVLATALFYADKKSVLETLEKL